MTVVISSFNRDDKVGETLEYLFRSQTCDFAKIEILIIDDGSPRPVSNVIEKIGPPPLPFELRLIEQANAGIGATRNCGFREAKYDLVLFLDDDILVNPETLTQFLEAHREHSGCVIFGSCPFRSYSSGSMEFFSDALYGFDKLLSDPYLNRVNAIASGLLFVDKSKLGDGEKFYRSDLAIPAAEEHEVIYRFHRQGIPIDHALHISATHNHHLELNWLVEQQYKYGSAMAEAFSKVPELIEMERYAKLKQDLEFVGFKGVVKRFAASGLGRSLLVWLARITENSFPNGNNNRILGLTATAFFWAGYTKGLRKFA